MKKDTVLSTTVTAPKRAVAVALIIGILTKFYVNDIKLILRTIAAYFEVIL
jgi:hypothetical protein